MQCTQCNCWPVLSGTAFGGRQGPSTAGKVFENCRLIMTPLIDQSTFWLPASSTSSVSVTLKFRFNRSAKL